MQALTFWKTVARDGSDLLEQVLAFLAANDVQYCVIGDQAVNAYAAATCLAFSESTRR
jgi:hypothetical protein